MNEVQKAIAAIVKKLHGLDVVPDITYPEPQFGDLATNVAFRLASELKISPERIALSITAKLKTPLVEKAEAKGGFINIWLKKAYFLQVVEQINSGNYHPKQILAQQTIVAEYSDPNPFKALHVGHLYTCIVGDAIANLQEALGASVKRVNFGGDVGMHVAKAMWGILAELGGENPQKLAGIAKNTRAGWLSAAYVKGAAAYEDDEAAKARIVAINKSIYRLHQQNDHESAFARIYWECRQWSYDYFDEFYKRIGSRFDKYYPESSNAILGAKTVKQQLKKGVFITSDGAVVFKGEKYGLHTRVFINSAGLPTYEAKDIGVALAKWQDYKFDRSIIITGNDIIEYMKVVLAALEQFRPELARKTTHLTHGMVTLRGQGKMSSRKGNVLLAEEVLRAVYEANAKINGVKNETISLAAIKYAFLKQKVGGNIVYDPVESVNLTGDSGPYLQYVYVRTKSILAKAGAAEPNNITADSINTQERDLIRHLGRYQQTLESAALTYQPHVLCAYLLELAQLFNTFYERHRVIGATQEAFRLGIVAATATITRQGLELLGINAPERM